MPEPELFHRKGILNPPIHKIAVQCYLVKEILTNKRFIGVWKSNLYKDYITLAIPKYLYTKIMGKLKIKQTETGIIKNYKTVLVTELPIYVKIYM